MAGWSVPPCLGALRAEFNAVAPHRDKGADGTIGDAAHKARSSDHNIDDGPDQGVTPYEDSDSDPEVHALDVDADGPWPDGSGREAGGWFDRTILALVARERREYEHPTIKGRLRNVIWRGRVCSRSWGWSEWRPADGHYDHAHFSALYDSQTEKDTRPWGVAEGEDVTKDEMKDALREVMPDVLDAWAKTPDGRAALASAVWTTDNIVSLDGPSGTPKDAGGQSLVQWPRAGYAKSAADKASAAHERATEAAAIGERVEAKVGEILSRLPVPPSQGQDGA